MIASRANWSRIAEAAGNLADWIATSQITFEESMDCGTRISTPAFPRNRHNIKLLVDQVHAAG
jgi:hypothetical protein